MKRSNVMILKDDKGQEISVEILFTFTSSVNDNTYVVYTDHSKDSDGKEKVYAGIYDEKEAVLNPIEDKEDYNIVENILATIESKNS